MKRADPFELTANKVTGVTALVLIGGLLLWWGLGWLLSGPVVEPRLFVAYFDESAGLRDGDAVRIQGRRAGHVTNVSVVQHEGRARARVEFAIAPGAGSPWLKEMVDSGGLPSDSSIRIRPGSIRGRPQLVITVGDDDEDLIPVGGEWKNARGANQEDTFSQWQEDISRARTQFNDLVTFFEGDRWSNLTAQLEELRKALESSDATVGPIAESLSGLSNGLEEISLQMNRMLDDVKVPTNGDPKAMQEFAGSLAEAGSQMDDLHKQLTEAADEIERLNEQSGNALGASESRQLKTAGLKLREMASRLRASMERAVIDPGQAGNLPPSRFWRPYFHGGEPRTGTSIDERPVAPPGEGIGVPKGTKDTKRVR